MQKEAEVAVEGTSNPELDRFLQFRARLEFAALMTRRQTVEEEVGEEEELVREVGGEGRNVGRSYGLRGWRDFRGRGGGGGGGGVGQKVGKVAVGFGGDREDGDGNGDKERSCDLVLPPPQLELRPRGLNGGGVGTSAQGEMDGLRGRMRRLTEEIRGVREALEERREQEEEARSRLVSGGKEGNGGRLPGTYFPSSPILSSLFFTAEEKVTVPLPGYLGESGRERRRA